MKWVSVSDNSAAAVTLQTGETDHTKGINASDYALFMDEEMNPLEDYKVAVIKGNMTYGVTFNSGENSLCSDINLRKAICYAIDAEAIADNIFGSYARAAGNYVNHAYGDYDESLEDLDNYYRYDADKAADYLAKSSYKGGEAEPSALWASPAAENPLWAVPLSACKIRPTVRCSSTGKM